MISGSQATSCQKNNIKQNLKSLLKHIQSVLPTTTGKTKKKYDEMKTLLIALVVAGGSVGPVVTTQAGPERGLIPI